MTLDYWLYSIAVVAALLGMAISVRAELRVRRAEKAMQQRRASRPAAGASCRPRPHGAAPTQANGSRVSPDLARAADIKEIIP